MAGFPHLFVVVWRLAASHPAWIQPTGVETADRDE